MFSGSHGNNGMVINEKKGGRIYYFTG